MSETEFASYVDENTSYVASDIVETITEMLDNDYIQLFK